MSCLIHFIDLNEDFEFEDILDEFGDKQQISQVTNSMKK